MSDAKQGIGLVEHVLDVGGTATLDGLGAAVSAATGYPFSEAEKPTTFDGWRPDATGSETHKSRVRYTLAEPRPVGSLAAGSISEMIGADAACRFSVGEEIEKPAAPLVEGKTALDITETQDWTLVLFFRAFPANLQTSTADIAEVRKDLTTSSNATRLVQVGVSDSGYLLIKLERFGGKDNELEFSSGSRIDDAVEHSVEIRFDGSSSPYTATVYLDKVSLGTVTTTEALAPETMCMAISGHHYVGQFELWDEALSSTELAAQRLLLKSGAEGGLVRGFNFSETSGLTVADATGTGNMTLTGQTLDAAAATNEGGGLVGLPSTGHGFVERARVTIASTTNYDGTYALHPSTTVNKLVIAATFTSETFGGTETVHGAWCVMKNRVTGHVGDAAARHQPWRRRNRLACVAEGSGQVSTDTDLSTSPVWHFAGRLRISKRMDSTFQYVAYFGTGVGASDRDWVIVVLPNGRLQFAISRRSGSSQTMSTATGTWSPGADMDISMRLDWAGTFTVEVDGVSVGSATAPAYTASSASKLVLHHGTTDFEWSGPVFMSRIPMSHTTARKILRGESHLIPETGEGPAGYADEHVYLWYGLNQDSGTTIANRGNAGSAGDLLVTSSGASWSLGTCVNSVRGPSRKPARRPYQTFVEVLDGISPEAQEFVFEMFDESAATLTVKALMAFDVLWLDYGWQDVNDVGAGPKITMTPARELIPAISATGRDLSYTARQLSLDESAEIAAHCIDSAVIYEGASEVNVKPIMLIVRSEDRNQWPVTCGVIVAKAPRLALIRNARPGHNRAVTIGGPELAFLD